jgi:cobalt-zinc-cadmium efflux system membrane fusion protein
MNALPTGRQRWFAAAALLCACALGFALARLTVRVPLTDHDTTPAQSADDASRSTLQIDASHLKVVGIELETVIPGSLSAEIQAPASISAAPDGQAVVSAHTAGTVVRINKRLGDPVRAGDTLAWVESRDAAAIAAERAVADSKAELARSMMEREKRLFEQHVTPRQDFEAAEAQVIAAEAEARSARLAAADAHVSDDGRSVRVTSPLSGRITSSTSALGAFVQADTELFRVADPTRAQIEASVTALDATRIAPGDPASIVTASGATHLAQVRSVTPTVNEQTRSATVVLSLVDSNDGPATQGALKPGEFVQVVITPQSAVPAGVVVPEDSIQRVDARDVVFVRTETGFRLQPVVVGARSGGRASILSGIAAHQTIATHNAFLLKAELGKGAEEDEE